jgi:hypothetical protein
MLQKYKYLAYYVRLVGMKRSDFRLRVFENRVLRRYLGLRRRR